MTLMKQPPGNPGRFNVCRTRLFEAVGRMEWSAFVTHRRSDLVHTLTVLQGRLWLGTGQTLHAAAQTLVVLTYLTITLTVSPTAALLVIAGGAMLAALQPSAFRGAFRHGRSEIVKGRRFFALVSDQLAGMQAAKSWAGEARQAASFETASLELAAAAVKESSARAESQVRLRIAQALVIAGGLWVCIAWMGMSGPSLLILAAVPIRLLPVLGNLMQAKRSIAEMLPAWSEYQSALETFRQSAEPSEQAAEAPTGDISLQGVTYHWPGGSVGMPAVADICLDLPEGSVTVLTGPSGAGKSTLAGIILGDVPRRVEICFAGAVG